MKKNAIKVLSVLVMTAAVSILGAASAFAEIYYVDVNSGKAAGNGTAGAPFQTIQKAADVVEPGDTVIIKPGIYYENVVLAKKGTREAPIIFKAEKFEKDSVIITGADRDVAEHKTQWTLEDAGLGLYSIPLDYQIYRMTANDVQVVEYLSLTGLKTYKYNATDDGNAGYAPGYEHGFFYDADNKKLYVRLGNDGCIISNDPNSPEVTVHFSRAETGTKSNWGGKSYGAQSQSAILGEKSFLFGVVCEDSANVVVEGITFKMPAVAAVWARCDDLTVNNCWFIGCIEGVRGGCAATADPYVSKNITIEHCLYTNYPIYTDAVKMIEKYRDDPKARAMDVDSDGKLILNENGQIPNVTVPKVLWFWHAKNGMTINYEGGGIACHIGENWVIRYNHFDDLLDGFSSFGNFSYWTETKMAGKVSLRQTPAKNIQIYGNKFDKILDNSIEMEDNVQGMEIAYNEFTRQISPFSWQPLSGIPYGTDINIHHNIVHNTAEESWMISSARNHIIQDGKAYRVSSPQYFGLFKLGASKSDFGNLSWMMAENFPMDASGNPIDAVYPGNDGIRVWNNTFIFPNAAFEENVGLLGGGVDNNSNIDFKNNIINVNVCAEDGTFKGGFKAGQAFTAARGVKFTTNMLVSGLNIEGSKEFGDITVSSAPRTAYVNEPIDDRGGCYKDSMDSVGFVDWRNGNFELREDSAARGRGVQLKYTDESTTDLGAVPYGAEWKMTAGPYSEADIDLDGQVTLADVSRLAFYVNSDEYVSRADLDFNGKIDQADLDIMLEIYQRNGGAAK